MIFISSIRNFKNILSVVHNMACWQNTFLIARCDVLVWLSLLSGLRITRHLITVHFTLPHFTSHITISHITFLCFGFPVDVAVVVGMKTMTKKVSKRRGMVKEYAEKAAKINNCRWKRSGILFAKPRRNSSVCIALQNSDDLGLKDQLVAGKESFYSSFTNVQL